VGTGGNHRGSIFRLHVGSALIKSQPDETTLRAAQTWGKGSTAGSAVRAEERGLELRVSAVIRSMPFLWLAVDDPPSPESERGVIESGSIALLSRLSNPFADPLSEAWLGHWADRAVIRESGL
jgi:hypothetical protein